MDVSELVKFILVGAALGLSLALISMFQKKMVTRKLGFDTEVQILHKDKYVLQACQRLKPYFQRDGAVAPHYKDFIQKLDMAMVEYSNGVSLAGQAYGNLLQTLEFPTNTALLETSRPAFIEWKTKVAKLVLDFTKA